MKQNELILRQQYLQLRSSELRIKLAAQTQVFKRPLLIADQTLSGLQWLYRNPQWPLAGLLVLLILRPQRFLFWGGRLWVAWKSFKRIQNWAAKRPRQGQLL
jgi:hypothetical protein